MLDYKDRVILEALTQYARISTRELARMIHLAQPSVVYRIRRLEQQGYIAKYDAIINHNKFPLIKEVLFAYVPPEHEEAFERFCTESPQVCWMIRLLDNMNYHLYCFFGSPEEQELFYRRMNSYTRSMETYLLNHVDFCGFSLFGMSLGIRMPRVKRDVQLKLDEMDISLMKHLADGGARDSIRDIAHTLGYHYESLLYRFKRLLKAHYFPMFIAQPGVERFSTQNDIVLMRSELGFRKLFGRIADLKEVAYLIELEGGVYYTQLLTNDFAQFKRTFETLQRRLRQEAYIRVYHTRDWLFLNRYPFERLIG